MNDPSQIISTILKHESKRNTYKIALVRAINDVALEYPHLPTIGQGIAIPLRLLAEFWIAYYWAFVDPAHPMRQGHDATDFSFRAELTTLRIMWQNQFGTDNPAEGYYIKNEMSLARKRETYSPAVHESYQRCVVKVVKALQQPICFAGTGEYNLFQKPQLLRELSNSVAIPSAKDQDLCLFVPMPLWQSFQKLSLWIEALCIHEWCLFVETVRQTESIGERGLVYTLLTARPDNRRPLNWERNKVDILLMEGYEFSCPWTQNRISQESEYDLDHIVPIAIRPINELWNLVPSDPNFNSHIKRDRLPSPSRLTHAIPILTQTYHHYLKSQTLKPVLETEASNRFGLISAPSFPSDLSQSASEFILSIAEFRHISQF